MLSDFQVERRELAYKGGSFHVEGLSLESFAVLVRTHLQDLEALFDLFEHSENLQGADIQRLAIAVLEEAPGFAANVIALAAGEPDAAPKAAKLPGPVQLEALAAIGELTFTEVGGVKKFLPTVAKLLGVTDMTAVVKRVTRKKAR